MILRFHRRYMFSLEKDTAFFLNLPLLNICSSSAKSRRHGEGLQKFCGAESWSPHHKSITKSLFTLSFCENTHKFAVIYLIICTIYYTKVHLRTLNFYRISQSGGHTPLLPLPQDDSLKRRSRPSPRPAKNSFKHLCSSKWVGSTYLSLDDMTPSASC